METITEELYIIPFVNVGRIRFGMPREEVEHVYTCVYKSFFKGSSRKIRSDHNEAFGIITHYDDTKCVDYIELVGGKHVEVKVFYKDTELTNFSVEQGVNFFLKESKDSSSVDSSYIFHDLGISISMEPSETKKLVENIGFSSHKEYWK